MLPRFLRTLCTWLYLCKGCRLRRPPNHPLVVNVFQTVLGRHGLSAAFDPHSIHIRPRFICEFTGSHVLSDAVLDCMFPREAGPIELDHFTPLDGFRGIAASRELRLYSVMKRLKEHEFTTFAREHRLEGYLRCGQHGYLRPYYRELAKDLFYSSLTRPSAGNEFRMFHVFADRGRGVRLRFRLSPVAAELRPIQYQHRSRPTLLRELNEMLVRQGSVPFIPWTLSKIGAFYLPLGYATEDELRLLIKRHAEFRGTHIDTSRSDGRYEYWPLPINTPNGWCQIELLRVTTGPCCDRNIVNQILASSTFAGVPVH